MLANKTGLFASNPEKQSKYDNTGNLYFIYAKLGKSRSIYQTFLQNMAAIEQEREKKLLLLLAHMAEKDILLDEQFISLVVLCETDFKVGYTMAFCLYLLKQNNLLEDYRDRLFRYKDDCDLNNLAELGLCIIFLQDQKWLEKEQLPDLFYLAERMQPSFCLLKKIGQRQNDRQMQTKEDFQQLIQDYLSDGRYVSSPIYN
jgi:hypothetical protein